MDAPIQCPHCKFIGPLDDWDCLGLGDEFDDDEFDDEPQTGNLACPKCLEQIWYGAEKQTEMF
jgi:hypothetical protein